MKSVPDLRTKERVVDPSLRLIDVEVGWHHIVIADERDGRIQGEQFACVRDQPFEPAQFVIELGSRSGIAVREVKAADDDAANGCLDIPAMSVVCIAG